MPTLLLLFPQIDPVAIQIGPLGIRWYAIAYVGGLLLGWWLCRRYVASPRLWGGPAPIAAIDIGDLVTWLAVGIVLGGRLGYVLFYNFSYYAQHPLDALALWHGGMAFHGGLVGAIAAMLLFARQRGLPPLSLLDLSAAVVPIGLFLGRIANFINGELFGRASDAPWAVVFPNGGPVPRHPSQLYEAALEGLVLFIVLQAIVLAGGLRRPGLVGGTFIAGYAIARTIGEQFREPDAQIGFLPGGLTMGALLSAPMLLVGVAAVWIALRRPAR